MSKLIFSLFCLILSAVLVFSAGSAVMQGGADSVWAFLLGADKVGLNQLLIERGNLNQALANADRIKNKILDLQKAENSISAEDLDKLNKFIPSYIDNVNLLIDINNIAIKRGMTIKNVKVRDSKRPETAAASASLSQTGILPAYMSFSITGNYETLVGFLDDLASSLRVIDPVSLSFSVDEKGVNQYNFEVKTYWVK